MTILFTANHGIAPSTLPRAMQLSPVKLCKSPISSSFLELRATKRLPYVCPYCLQWYNGPLKCHLESNAHKDHMHFPKLMNLKDNDPKGYKAELGRLNVLGRLRSNIRALELKDRPIIPARRVNDHEKHKSKLVWCSLCKKCISKKAYRETHLDACSAAQALRVTKEEKILLAKNAEPVVETNDETMARLLKDKDSLFKEVLFEMRTADRVPIAEFFTTDVLAEAMLMRMATNGRGKHNWVANVRHRVRTIYHIFLYFKSTCNDVTTLMDVMQYDVWHATPADGKLPRLIECCYAICGRDEERNTFKLYNEVMYMSSLLQQLSDTLENHLHHPIKTRLMWRREGKMLTSFLLSDTWRLFTVRPAARQKALKVNFKKVMVKNEDFRFYLDHVEGKAQIALEGVKSAWHCKNKKECIKHHTALVEALPIAIGTFSYRRVSEPFLISVEEFSNRPDLQKLKEDHKHLLSDGAEKEIERVVILESRGKGDHPVLTVVKVRWLEALELLSQPGFREYIGLPSENRFLFGIVNPRCSSLGHANPSRCQAKFALQCKGNVENHMFLRSRNFRLTFATNLGGLDLTYGTKKLLCAVLGHSLNVHEKHYHIPQHVQVAAYMGFACHAGADNTLREKHDKTIETLVNMQVEDNDINKENEM